jgi:peptidoglycan/LPS O-acetylase OafA/YrhL
MESPNRQYLPAIDHLRAFAALLIIAYHSFHLLYPRIVFHRAWQGADWIHTRSFFLAPVIEGHTAVALFLVISGFILTYGSLGRPVSYRDFFWNRFLRIFPLFFFFLITAANAFRPQFQILPFLTSVLQFGYLGQGPIFAVWAGVAWSVSVEAHLYFLFPAIRHYLNRNLLWPLFRLAIILWLVRLGALALGADVEDLTYWTALGRFDQFLAGGLLAWLLYRYGIPRKMGMFFPAALLGSCAILYVFHLSGGFPARQTWRIAWPTIEAVFWAVFVASYLGFAGYLPRIANVVLQFLGRISYSLYLVHVVVISIIAVKGWYFALPSVSVTNNILLTAALLILPLVILISTLTYTAIEAPFLSMRRRYSGKEPLTTAAAS